jgi:hypothetical protein
MPVGVVSIQDAVGDDPSGDGDDADDEAGDEGGERWLVVRVVKKGGGRWR